MSIYNHEQPCGCDECIERTADETVAEEYDERMVEAARED